jgi:hypothetical protein
MPGPASEQHSLECEVCYAVIITTVPTAVMHEACYLVSAATVKLLTSCTMVAAKLSGKTQADVTGITFIYIAHTVVAVACIPKSQSAVGAEQCQAMSAAYQQHRIERFAMHRSRANQISALHACMPTKAVSNS